MSDGTDRNGLRNGAGRSFDDRYGAWPGLTPSVREEQAPVLEDLVQWIWREQRFAREGLQTLEGHRIEVVSPGWWNRLEGPDFRQAEIRFNGAIHAGDIEIHLSPEAWKSHGHEENPGYNNVILHVVLEPGNAQAAHTRAGRRLPVLVLESYLDTPIEALAAEFEAIGYSPALATIPGKCGAAAALGGDAALYRFLGLAGEWRMLEKARRFQERASRCGFEQSLYEATFTACGYGPYKSHFEYLARHLPYDRAIQLARRDPRLLEAALLQVAGLIPDPTDEEDGYLLKVRALREEHLPGLRSLDLDWRFSAVRPNNRPERRIGGFCVFMGRIAHKGLAETIETVWRMHDTPLDARRAFEKLFPRALGYWANHCTWNGRALSRPSSPLGESRVRSIIGNIFVPAALAAAREAGDRRREAKVQAFFAALPGEAANRIQRIMLPRLGLEPGRSGLTFQLQQGLLQMHLDWCEPNPACRNCTVFETIRHQL